VEFCCADVGQEVMVELLVTDAGGFSNSCMAFVEVQDKRFPTIFCPPDITVSCEFFIPDYSIFGTVVTDPADAQEIVINDPANPYTGSNHVWGFDGVAYDNCGVRVEIIYEGENIDECGEGVIRRVFEATDNQGNSRQCEQVIRVVDFDPFYINPNNPFDTRDDIVWPRDYVLEGCLNEDTDPEDLPGGYDEPVVLDDECSLVAYDYDDVVFQYVDGYCYKIVRTWTVIDWCQFDQTNPFGGGYWQYNQLIMVVDDELPEFSSGCEADPLINQLNDDGCSAMIDLSATATDNCTDPEDLRWNYEIDENNDGSIEHHGEGNSVSGIFEYGEHKITWYVEDECGNVNHCSKVFIVEDHKKPTPICYEGIVTVPMPTTGTVEIFAKSFNICNGCEAGSYDNCTPQDELVFTYSQDINDVSRVFSCDDIENGILDTIEIEMWVTDLAGNQEFCNTYLILQDNQDICPDAAPIVYDIAGMVLNQDDEVIEGVEVSLNGPGAEFPLYSVSGSSGFYSFNDVDAYQNYQMTAYSDEDPMGGISTLDLVFIQKHLLGLNTLDNAYEIIAADVNGSGSISAADLLDLRKLILGVEENLNNNESWQFVVAEEDFEENTNPFPLNEVHQIEGLRFHSLQNHFIGIKVGDVNHSLQLNGSIQLDERMLETTTLYSSEKVFESGDEVEMDVFLGDLRQPQGMQFTVAFDYNKLDFQVVESGQALVNQTNYHQLKTSNGLLTFSWNRSGEPEFNTDLPVLKLVFKAKAGGNLTESIEFNSGRTTAEVYYGDNENYNTENIELRFRDGDQVSSKMVLYQNTPNPFSRETSISYFLPMKSEAMLSVYDVDGSLVFEATNTAHKGRGSFEIDNEGLDLNEGIYYYSLKAGKDISTRKMIIIR